MVWGVYIQKFWLRGTQWPISTLRHCRFLLFFRIILRSKFGRKLAIRNLFFFDFSVCGDCDCPRTTEISVLNCFLTSLADQNENRNRDFDIEIGIEIARVWAQPHEGRYLYFGLIEGFRWRVFKKLWNWNKKYNG